MHLHVLLKSTALLEALPTDLAVEVGVLPGLALPPSSGTGGNLPHQVPLALQRHQRFHTEGIYHDCAQCGDISQRVIHKDVKIHIKALTKLL